MNCPDENLISRVLSGNASAEERAEFHGHLDQCAACMQLIEVLGHVGELRLEPDPLDPRTPLSRSRADQRIALIALLFLELSCAIILLPVCWRFVLHSLGHRDGFSSGNLFCTVWVAYLSVYLVAGPIIALVAFYGLVKNRKWSTRARILCAWTALPAGFLAPIATYNLRLVRKAPPDNE